jgi:hypothetical protein
MELGFFFFFFKIKKNTYKIYSTHSSPSIRFLTLPQSFNRHLLTPRCTSSLFHLRQLPLNFLCPLFTIASYTSTISTHTVACFWYRCFSFRFSCHFARSFPSRCSRFPLHSTFFEPPVIHRAFLCLHLGLFALCFSPLRFGLFLRRVSLLSNLVCFCVAFLSSSLRFVSALCFSPLHFGLFLCCVSILFA